MFDATTFVQTLSDAMQTDMSARPFPDLDAAVEKFMAASRKLQEVTKLKLSMQRHYNFIALRRAVDVARHDIDMAFATEMLPKIMCGGMWCQIRATARMPDHSSYGGQLIVDAYPTLLQYPLEFRAVGRNGKPSRFFAIVARSFDIFDGELVRRVSRLAALGLVEQFEHPHLPTTPLGVWAMHDYGDGDNGLVVVAHGLVPEDAGQFGMIALAPAAN